MIPEYLGHKIASLLTAKYYTDNKLPYISHPIDPRPFTALYYTQAAIYFSRWDSNVAKLTITGYPIKLTDAAKDVWTMMDDGDKEIMMALMLSGTNNE